MKPRRWAALDANPHRRQRPDPSDMAEYDDEPDDIAERSPAELTDDDFLALVAEERRQSVGFEHDEELSENRERSLNYLKGVMTDVPALAGRSAAISTDLSDAVETLMPDLMEILASGDDIATFRPVGEEDVDAARQETDYVNHVMFVENPGWRNIYVHCQDALLSKIGVLKISTEQYDEEAEEHFQGKTALEMAIADQAGELEVTAEYPAEDGGEPTYDFVLRQTKARGRTCVVAWPPEDFTVARDTVELAKTTYCAARSRPRAQALIEDGYDPDLVAELSQYGVRNDTGEETARDNAGEHNNASTAGITSFNLHQVEIVEHIVRVDADGDGIPELWRVVTGNGEGVLLKRERIDDVPFAVSTPFIVAHRLYGRSLADMVMEIQKIKTVLLRMALDSGYFAMNQRSEVAMDRANEFTLSDLLNYVPGAPIRSKTGDAVRSVSAGALDFDVFGALEQVSVMGEQRSGVVRNAQGLNPDTLHDTARGAMAMVNAAQKRVRMIARVFSETGLKDALLLVHSSTRKHPSAAEKVRLRGQWVEVDPSTFGSRKDMVVEIGVGSGGREQQLIALQQVIGAQEKVISLQGGQAAGPVVTMQNVYDTAQRLVMAAGMKSVDPFFTDPSKAAAGQAQPGAEKVDPDQVQAQQQAELDKYKIDQDIAFKDRQLQAEIGLKRYQIDVEARMKAADYLAGGTGGSDVHFGGNPG